MSPPNLLNFFQSTLSISPGASPPNQCAWRAEAAVDRIPSKDPGANEPGTLQVPRIVSLANDKWAAGGISGFAGVICIISTGLALFLWQAVAKRSNISPSS